MSARTGIREPGLTIKHVGPIGAALIATIAVTAGLGLALGIRPAASQGVLVPPTADLVEFRAGERLPLVAPTVDPSSSGPARDCRWWRPRLTSSSSGPASDCRSWRPRLTSSSSGPASDCRSCRPRLTSSSSGPASDCRSHPDLGQIRATRGPSAHYPRPVGGGRRSLLPRSTDVWLDVAAEARRCAGKVGLRQGAAARVQPVAAGEGDAREGLLVAPLCPDHEIGIHPCAPSVKHRGQCSCTV